MKHAHEKCTFVDPVCGMDLSIESAPEEMAFKGRVYAGSTREDSAGNGSVMRFAPVPIAFATRPSIAIALAGESSRTTHGALDCIDSCRYLAGVLVGLINGASKQEVLAPFYSP